MHCIHCGDKTKNSPCCKNCCDDCGQVKGEKGIYAINPVVITAVLFMAFGLAIVVVSV